MVVALKSYEVINSLEALLRTLAKDMMAWDALKHVCKARIVIIIFQ